MEKAKQHYKDSIIRIDTRSKWFNLFLIGLCFFFLLSVRLGVNQTLGGDEPAYLLMSYSLTHDHDLNLSNNYINKDYLSFAPHAPSIQGSPTPGTSVPSKDYSQHGIGLPIFLLPGFALTPLLFTGFSLAARAGAVFEMLVLATAVVWLTWLWTKQITKNRKAAYVAAALLAVSYFFSGLAGYFYPDMLISGLVLVALIILERYYSKTIFQLLLGLVLGFLVLVHIKTLDIVLPVLLILSYKLWKSEHKLPWLTTLIVAVFVVYYFVSYHQWFGVWGIVAGNGSGGSQFGDNPFNSISAMLFDSFRGFLVYNPVMIFIFLGLPLWFKKNRKSLLLTLAALLPSIGVLSVFYQWNGGDAPVGRYIIDFLPAFIPALAFAIESLSRVWEKIVIGLAAIVTFLITIDATMQKFPLVDPGLLANQARAPLFIQIQARTGLALDHFLPKYSQYLFYPTTFIDHHGLLKTMAGYLIVLSFFIYGYYLSRLKQPRRV